MATGAAGYFIVADFPVPSGNTIQHTVYHL
jgi:hypothetical protein